MSNAVFLMMYLATAPIALMPAIIALFTRHPRKYAILGCNLALWLLAFIGMAPGAILGLLGYLALFAWTIKGGAPSSVAPKPDSEPESKT